MKPINEIVSLVNRVIGQQLTEMQERPTQKQSATTTILNPGHLSQWERFLEWDTRGSDSERQKLVEMLSYAAVFIKSIKAGSPPFWLSLLGKSGTGKTYLARKLWRWYKGSSHFTATADDAGNITYPGQWCQWPTFAGDLLNNEGYGRLDDLQTEKLVVFDEIGADRDPSGHVRDCLARVLSARIGKWTIITSNKGLGEIQRDIDTRISSRMLRDGSIVVDVDMPDYAVRKLHSSKEIK